MTKEELRQFRSVDREIKRLEEIVEILEARELGSSVLSHMPRYASIGNDTREILIDTKKQLAELIEQHTQRQSQIIQRISLLTDSRHRILLYMRYVEGKRFEDIACEMNYSWRQVHRLHGEALEVIA